MQVPAPEPSDDLPEEKGPERTCIVTRQKGGKDALIRFVLDPAKRVTPDIRAKLPGRGAWVLADRATLAGAVKRKAFARAFKTPQGMDWARKWLTAYPSPKNWRDVIISYGFSNDSPVKLDTPQKIDLFRLMRASKSLADQNDYMEYAQYATDKGLPAEAAAVLKEGMATGKIPAGNATAKDMTDEESLKYANENGIPLPDMKDAAQTGAAPDDQDAIAEQLQQVAAAPTPDLADDNETKTPKKGATRKRRSEVAPEAATPASPDKKRRRSGKNAEVLEEPKKSGRKKTKGA